MKNLIPWALEQTSKLTIGSTCRVVRGYNIPLGTIVVVDTMQIGKFLKCMVHDMNGVIHQTYVTNLEVIAVPINWFEKKTRKAI